MDPSTNKKNRLLHIYSLTDSEISDRIATVPLRGCRVIVIEESSDVTHLQLKDSKGFYFTLFCFVLFCFVSFC